MGAIRLAKTKPLPERLEQVFTELTAELERWRPDAVAIEEVFYSVNAKSALKLGQVRGVALLAAARQGIPVAEYAPLKIKSSVVGYGLAKKEQVQFMVARLLGLAAAAGTGRRSRCPGHRHLPHSYRADAGSTGGQAMRAFWLLAAAFGAGARRSMPRLRPIPSSRWTFPIPDCRPRNGR